jgi:hypothetical protein
MPVKLTPATIERLEDIRYRVAVQTDAAPDAVQFNAEPFRFGLLWSRAESNRGTRFEAFVVGHHVRLAQGGNLTTTHQPRESADSVQRLAAIRQWWADNATADWFEQARTASEQARADAQQRQQAIIDTTIDDLAFHLSGFRFNEWASAAEASKVDARRQAMAALRWTADHDRYDARPGEHASLTTIHEYVRRLDLGQV